MEGIVNRVEKSGLIQFNLEDFLEGQEFELYDIKDNLFQEMIIREKDLREFVKTNDWSVYKGKHIGIYCSTDAIIPTWAYMLLITALKPYAASVSVTENKKRLVSSFLLNTLQRHDFTQYQDGKVVIKGCSDVELSEQVYGELTNKLMPYAKIIMFGEPCSTVPIYKKKKE
ncbi:MAG: DUF2480 family protein [Cyclobacteriaceae bacterium]